MPKLLLLADTDRLDDELTIAQMQARMLRAWAVARSLTHVARLQGRFQLVLVRGAGHALQEDAPEATAAALAAFVRRCAAPIRLT